MLEKRVRYVNKALGNDLAVLHEILRVDFIEAIDAAGRSLSLHAHYPDPGLVGIDSKGSVLPGYRRRSGVRVRMSRCRGVEQLECPNTL